MRTALVRCPACEHEIEMEIERIGPSFIAVCPRCDYPILESELEEITAGDAGSKEPTT